jgi:dTDP-4-dehydrorhamnose reductase
MRDSVFITGGSGLLGVSWAVAVRDERPVTLGIHERAVALKSVEVRRTDLESADELSRLLASTGSRVVVHAAGLTNVETCEADPARAAHVNVTLARNVATACARAGIALIHISTDHLFGASESAASESDPVTPVNVYARTKAEAEGRVLDAHPGAIVARTNFYGWGPSYRRSFSDTILAGLRGGTPQRLFRDVVYTPILMAPLIRAAHELVDRKASGIFHLTGDDALSKHEFGIRIARAFGLDENLIVRTSIREMTELVPRPSRMVLSNRKATSVLGRSIGGVDEHLALLRQQEHTPSIEEIRRL